MTNSLKKFSKTLAQLNDDKLINNLLADLLTPAESEDIATRIKILKMLHRGLPQREISERLGLSVATVTRGSRVLKYGTGAVTKLLNKKKL